MRLYELACACHLYATSGFDESFKKFQQATKPALDFKNESHGQALMKWLNTWGCRQFAKKFHSKAWKGLQEWAKNYLDRLPSADSSLIELPQTTLKVIAEAYGDLRQSYASTRKRRKVTVGATGAAKVLFAIRPRVCPPWDDVIREKLDAKWPYDGSPDSYSRFLSQVQKELNGLKEEAANFGISLDEVPAKVGRPESTLPKLVDEYNWVTYTHGCQAPTIEELKRWLEWSAQSTKPADSSN